MTDQPTPKQSAINAATHLLHSYSMGPDDLRPGVAAAIVKAVTVALATGEWSPDVKYDGTADTIETICNRCHGPNITWSAPSPLWNEVMRGGDINGPWQYGELICPICFARFAEAAGIADLWRFDAARVNVPLTTVTPSGRTWNAETWLWEDAADGTQAEPSSEQDGAAA